MYFKNALSGSEKHAFEKSMMQDKFEEEAFEGLSKLSYEELHSDLQEIQNKLNKKERKKYFFALPVYRYAAGILLFISIGSLIYILTKSVEKTSQLAESMNTEDSVAKSMLPSQSADSLSEIAQTIPTDSKEKGTEPVSPEQVETYRTPSILYEEEADMESVSEPVMTGSVADITDVDEVVVIGYGTQKRSDVTGAISSTESLARNELPVEQALQGKAAGLSVSKVNGSPGSDTKVRIRGISSIDGKTSTLSGNVVSASDGLALPGVSVLIEGTEHGTITDINGSFTIEVPNDRETSLQFAYLGYVTEDYEITDENTITVAMAEDLIALDEVVVIGYGVQKKSELTGSVATVNMEEVPAAAPLIVHSKPLDGMRDFRVYVEKNTQYDKLPEFDKTVVVKLRFTINASGLLSDINIEKSAGELFDMEAIRLLQAGPKWMPATQNGIPFEEKVNLKIKFEPKEE